MHNGNKRGDTLTIKNTSIKVKLIEFYAETPPYGILYGVEYDYPIAGGHSCQGVGTPDHCRWMKPSEFENF